MKRNTSKEKARSNKNFPYKHRKICTKCGRPYGTDTEGDNGRCPVCCHNTVVKGKKLKPKDI